MMEWEKYEPSGEYIPVEAWGKDHWSTLAYLETRCVDHDGKINNKQMRCNSRLHRGFAHSAEGSDYPTRLKDGSRVERHDDWSCLEDMIAAGIFDAWHGIAYHHIQLGHMAAKVKLTTLGAALAGQLRSHKATGGNFANFVPNLTVTRNDVPALAYSIFT